MPPAHGGGGGASLTAPCPQHPGAYPGNPCSSLFSVCSIKLHLLASLLRAGHCGFLPTRTYLPSPETPSFSVTVVTSPRETQQETWAWHVWDGTASQRKSTGQGVGGKLYHVACCGDGRVGWSAGCQALGSQGRPGRAAKAPGHQDLQRSSSMA